MKKTYPSWMPLTEEQKREAELVWRLDLPWWISLRALELIGELVQSTMGNVRSK